MLPIEGQSMLSGNNQNSISLSVLIHYIIHKTYDDLTVLSELLPRKSDLERKKEIYQFANTTKQLFVRLLAVVKWINSANKVEKCARITSILQEQQMIFIGTADALYRMAKETLVRARLPCFSLPAAVDVLTIGTYPRLPHCIKEKIIPPESLPPMEKKKVLSKLTQVVEYRIVTSDLPACMCKPVLDNGRVKFLVDHEFEVTLTLMGDMPNIPWRLLKIDILVEDHENGNSSSLVHPKQVEFLREVAQMRLLESDQPLHDLYNCLHYFCQSLQLEVLNYQVTNLIREKFGDHMKVEEYFAGKSLTISYWRDHTKSKAKPYHQGFKLNVHVDDKKIGKLLQITHFPQIMGVDGVKCLKQINVACLSIEKVWTHTAQIRSTIKLKELKRELEMFMQLKCGVLSIPPMITIQLVPPLKEVINISVDDLKGTFIVHLPASVSSFEARLVESLNSDKKDLRHIIHDIKQQITMFNYQKLIESSPMTLTNYTSGLPFVDTKNIHVVKLNNLTKNKLVIKYEKDAVRFYLHGENKSREIKEISSDVIEKWITIYLKEGSLSDGTKSSPGSKLFSGLVTNFGDLSNELMLLHTYSGDILCFTELSEELLKHGIYNTKYLPDSTGVGLVLAILSFPIIEGTDDEVKEWTKMAVQSAHFRLVRRERISWLVEIIFTSSPFKNKNGLYHLTFSYELGDSKSTVSSFIDDWSKVCHLYQVALPFAEACYDAIHTQSSLPAVEIVSYTFNKMSLSYGCGNAFCVDIFYNPKTKNFQLIFSTLIPLATNNCHSFLTNYLEHSFNDNKSLFQLCKILEETSSIWMNVNRLSTAPIPWLKKSLPHPIPVQCFTIVPQSPSHVRLVFQSMYCIEVNCSSNVLTIKDGCLSKNNVEVFLTIPGLQTFIDNFISEIQSMKINNKKDDDSQSSPMGVEPMDFISTSINFMNHNSPLTHKLTASSPAHMLMHSGNNSPSAMFSQSPANVNISSRSVLEGGLQVISPELFKRLVTQLPSSPGSPLDHFLGATYFKRHLQMMFAPDDSFTVLSTTEPTSLTVKCEMLNLNMKFIICNYKLQLKVIPLQDSVMPWQTDDLIVLEKYFESKVAVYPFKPTRLEAFVNLLKAQYHVLKDFVQILRLDLNPDKNLNWHVQFLLTLPHGTGMELGFGSCALLVSRKIMFVLKFTKNALHASGSELTTSQSFVVAVFFYEPMTNYVQVFDNQKNANTNMTSLVKRYNEYSIKTNECCLFSCILELINNLQLMN